MPRVAVILVILAGALLPAAALAQVDPGTLIIAGAGWGPNWDTEIELADSPLGVGTSGSIFKINSLLAPCPPNCDSHRLHHPSQGHRPNPRQRLSRGIFPGAADAAGYDA